MLMRALVTLLPSLVLLVMEAGEAGAEAGKRPRVVDETVWVDGVRDAARAARGGAPAISNILYVNRCIGGCVLTPAAVSDARQNTSAIVPGPTTITEFEWSDETYDRVIECLRDVYSPYNVQIVTEDPGPDTIHHEAILAGKPAEVGRGPNVGGIAPASCSPLDNAISFSFANMLGDDVEQLCWTVAQESAHSFGLPNHVYNCLDPMTYIEGPCGRKYFRNQNFQCGEFEPGPCSCGGEAQNSHVELLRTFGPGAAPPAPQVSLVYPAADSSVRDNFSIFFTARDPRLVDHADVYLNGTKYATVPGHDYASRNNTYDVDAPDLPDGYIDVEIRAYNEISGEAGTAAATVLKGEPCSSAADCFEFQECSEGRCSYPEAVGELGDRCGYDGYCTTGPCIEAGDEHRCSQSCNASVAGSCPAGFDCLNPGYCWPHDSSGGGCGTVAGGQESEPSLPLGLLSLFAGAMMLFRRGGRRLS